MTDLRTENVQDYPRPPAVERVPQRLRVLLAGTEIANSTDAWRVLETHHAPTYYIPTQDILPGALRPAPGSSHCEWKGRAAYFDVLAEQTIAPRGAWTYPMATAGFTQIEDHVAFYPGAMSAAWVGAYAVTAQPGDFYGGWVTSNLTGIVKGGPGTLGW